jgi:hypothetical protein
MAEFRSRRLTIISAAALATGVLILLLFTEPSGLGWFTIIGGAALVAWVSIKLVRERDDPLA